MARGGHNPSSWRGRGRARGYFGASRGADNRGGASRPTSYASMYYPMHRPRQVQQSQPTPQHEGTQSPQTGDKRPWTGEDSENASKASRVEEATTTDSRSTQMGAQNAPVQKTAPNDTPQVSSTPAGMKGEIAAQKDNTQLPSPISTRKAVGAEEDTVAENKAPKAEQVPASSAQDQAPEALPSTTGNDDTAGTMELENDFNGYADGTTTYAAHNLPDSGKASPRTMRQRQEHVFETVESTEQKSLDSLFASAEKEFWFPDQPNANMGIRSLLSQFFSGPRSKPGDKLVVNNQEMDPRFELAVRDVLTLQSGEQLTSTMIEALVLTHCSIDYTTSSGYIAKPFEMVALYTTEQKRVFDVLVRSNVLPFLPKDNVENVYGVVNNGGVHWIAFHIERKQRVVTIVDSMKVESEADRAPICDKMKVFLNRMAALDIADESWKSTMNSWTIGFVNDPYQQRNFTACGIYAVQNFIDLMFQEDIKKFQDSDVLRHVSHTD